MTTITIVEADTLDTTLNPVTAGSVRPFKKLRQAQLDVITAQAASVAAQADADAAQADATQALADAATAQAAVDALELLGLVKLGSGADAPTVNDDVDAGYSPGSRYFATTQKARFECVDNTADNAIWAGVGGAHVSDIDDESEVAYDAAAAVVKSITLPANALRRSGDFADIVGHARVSSAFNASPAGIELQIRIGAVIVGAIGYQGDGTADQTIAVTPRLLVADASTPSAAVCRAIAFDPSGVEDGSFTLDLTAPIQIDLWMDIDQDSATAGGVTPDYLAAKVTPADVAPAP